MSEQLRDWLWTLFDAEPDGAFIELRQLGGGERPHREFVPIIDLERVGSRILELGAERDAYIGVAPRSRREGGKAAICRSWVLWADCDGLGAVDRVAEFEPAPTLVVWSGSRGRAHAYWRLGEAESPAAVEMANRRLAHHFGADTASTDATRILRPPSTRNFKYEPPAPVVLDGWRGGVYPLEQVVGDLADPPTGRREQRPCERHVRAHGAVHYQADDPLLSISPPVYVEALTGREVGRDGKVACPFHDDRTPSLHVYDEPGRGWTCFGCGRGGTIVDLGAALYGIKPRGAGYHQIVERLRRDLRAGLARAAA